MLYFQESATFIAMKKRGLFFFALLLTFILALYAVYIFPIPATDSLVYIPTALLYSKGQGLANPLYYVSKFTDPTGTNQFNYYVPFQPLMLGALSKIKPDVRTIFLWCWVINTVSLLLYTQRITGLVREAKPVVRFAAFLSLSYVFMYVLPTAGRPECITILLVMLTYLLYHRRHSTSPVMYGIAISVLCGLMLCTQILCCFFCFLFFVTYELLETKNVWRTVGINLLRFAGVVVVCCGVISLSPIGLPNTLEGIATHATYAMTRVDRTIPLFIYYWILSPVNFAFLGIFCVAAFYYVRELRTKLKMAQPLQLTFVIILQLIIAVSIVKFILYASPTVYNATQFILPISAYILYNLSQGEGKKKLSVAVVLATFAAGSLLFLRSFVLFVDYVQDGRTYDKARERVADVVRQYPGAYISQGLWSLIDDPNKANVYWPGQTKSGDVIIVQQAYHPFRPELVGKVTILMDWRTTDQRKLLGIPLTKRPQGYSFVVCRVN